MSTLHPALVMALLLLACGLPALLAWRLQRGNAGLRAALARQGGQQARLRPLLDNVPALIAHIDPQRRYLLVNRAYLAWDQRQREDIVGHSVDDVHGPAGSAQLAPHLERALAGQTTRFEARLQRQGRLHLLQVTYVPERDERGLVTGVFALKTDVTAERRASDRLRQVMDAAPLGMFTTDAQGRCDYVNAALERMAGRPAADCLGHGLHPLLHPDDAVGLVAGTAVTSGSREYGVDRPGGGGGAWLRSNLAPLRLDGVAEGHVGTLEDLSGQRSLQGTLAARSADLARSNAELARFADLASHDLQEPVRVVSSFGQLLLRRHGAQLAPEARECVDHMVDAARHAQALVRDLRALLRVDAGAWPVGPVALDVVLEACLREQRDAIDAAGAVLTRDPLPTVLGDRVQLGQLLGHLVANALKFRRGPGVRVHVAALRGPGQWQVSVSDDGIGIAPEHAERIFGAFKRLHPHGAYAGTGIGLAICRRVAQRHGGQLEVQSQPGQGSTFTLTLPDGATAPTATAPEEAQP